MENDLEIAIAVAVGFAAGIFFSHMRISQQIDEFRLTLAQLKARNELMNKMLDRIERGNKRTT